MPKLVTNSAKLKCDQGLAPGTLTVLPTNLASGGLVSAATATSAALGVLTPMPCIPVVTAPWSPGASGAEIAGQKALTDDSKCNCIWTGSIITDPGSDIDVE